MSWFKKIFPSRVKTDPASKKQVPEGLWTKCDHCQAILYRAELEKRLEVCPKCQHHMYMSARKRLQYWFDGEQFNEIAADVEAVDHLKFKDRKKYKDRLSSATKTTGEKEALVAAEGYLFDHPIVACAFEYHFIGGSMGSAVGERFVQAANRALQEKKPLICFAASGGARMQEGLMSLMQMAKTSAVIRQLHQAGIPYISVLTHPTMGGVSASLATLGDVLIAEPNALIGFAGPRVIEQTVRETLPEGFQRSEFLLEQGAIDMIVDRGQLRDRVAGLLAKFCHHAKPETQKKLPHYHS